MPNRLYDFSDRHWYKLYMTGCVMMFLAVLAAFLSREPVEEPVDLSPKVEALTIIVQSHDFLLDSVLKLAHPQTIRCR